MGGILLAKGGLKEAMKVYAKAINANRMAGLGDTHNIYVQHDILSSWGKIQIMPSLHNLFLSVINDPIS